MMFMTMVIAKDDDDDDDDDDDGDTCFRGQHFLLDSVFSINYLAKLGILYCVIFVIWKDIGEKPGPSCDQSLL